MPALKILFIVSLFNNERTIQESLEAILNQKGKAEKNILVVDDQSADESLNKTSALAEKFPCLRILRQKHQGQALALNLGLKKAQDQDYDFIALVEADVKIAPCWLEKNLQVFAKKLSSRVNGAIMGVGGLLHPFPDDSWIARIAGYEIAYKMEHQKKQVKHLTSANVIYRSAVFKKIGLFREDLRNSAFDAEFNQRVINAGFRLIYNRKAQAHHHYKPTVFLFLKRAYAYAYFRPALKIAALYPYDRVIQIQIFILAIFPFLFLLFIFAHHHLLIICSCLLAIIYFISTLPPLVWTLKNKKDPVILLYPLINFLRNLAAIFGLTLGIARKTRKSYAKNSQKF
ncbi:hypothetical protein COT68_00545 [bacterium (Candidatus Torokbacteria) CG09_land_8_20_14_0_10_42_11]|nr:MAG: hypothetical protein COT68_00545 [bacterium (Candidatus Torokbacteria) CG09_land_8_20_14_0_10_42_11]